MDDVGQVAGAPDVAIIQIQAHILAVVRVPVNVVQPAGVEIADPADDAVDFIALGQ